MRTARLLKKNTNGIHIDTAEISNLKKQGTPTLIVLSIVITIVVMIGFETGFQLSVTLVGLFAVAVAAPTFSVYGLAAKAASAEIVNIQSKEDFTIDVDAFIEGAKDAKLSFLCTPNNPTGTTVPAEDVKRILENISGFLFLDCAYIEFADEDYYQLLSYDNLIIGRTLSKVYGLAGLRIGYAFVPEWFVGPYMAGVTPFSLNCVSEAAGVAALENPECKDALVSHVRSWRKRFEEEIPFPVLPSGANFVLINTAPIKSDDAVKQLQKMGILVRSCSSFPGLGETYVRVSIGDDWENERFLEGVKKLC